MLYIFITRLASNEIFSPPNKIYREVGRAKDLSEGSSGGKGGRCLGLTTFASSCAYGLEILEASNSWTPKLMSSSLTGRLYLIYSGYNCTLPPYCNILLYRSDVIRAKDLSAPP